MECFDLKKFFSNWRGVLLLFLGGLAVLGPVGWALWCIPPWQVEQVRVRLDEPADEYRLATLEDEYRRTLVQSIGGFFLLVGLYLTWRRIVATEKNVSVAQENVSVALTNVSVAEEGQITERFTKAIAQLGDDKMAIRLGGIYALERIARDSEKDHGPIMEVLTAYVRENATKEGEYAEKAAQGPTIDIQAILTVLGRRETTDGNRLNNPLDLSNTHLVGAELGRANLHLAFLVGANLSRAILNRANLRDANLQDANLEGAKLRGAILDDANLDGAKNLTEEQVRSAISRYHANLPGYIKHLKDLTKQPPPA